jgi:hypothetical protein
VRDGSVTDRGRCCGACGGPLPDTDPRRRYCSGACRTAAHRARRARPAPPARLTPTATAPAVYECPGCEGRLVGARRCPECNLFCRSLGPGGECPCCGEPLAISELFGPSA